MNLTPRECELFNTLLSAEIMKMQFHYDNRTPKRLQELYDIRDKVIKENRLRNGNPCFGCDCYDPDAEGCTMPSVDRAYACSLEHGEKNKTNAECLIETAITCLRNDQSFDNFTAITPVVKMAEAQGIDLEDVWLMARKCCSMFSQEVEQ